MNLEYVPLLETQRRLQGMPRGMDRFREYLRTIGAAEASEIKFPSLVAMNPMGKEHVTALLDEFLAMKADEIAERAVAEAVEPLAGIPGDYKVTITISDDLKGGWTNRYACESGFRFPEGPTSASEPVLPRWLKDFWISGYLWSSEPADPRIVREAVLTAVYRTAHFRVFGAASTLREKLAQEGRVLLAAGCVGPALDEEEIDYTRQVIAPFLDENDKRITVECLFGDAGARTLGFTPRGLSPWAGLALALHDARLAEEPWLPSRPNALAEV